MTIAIEFRCGFRNSENPHCESHVDGDMIYTGDTQKEVISGYKEAVEAYQRSGWKRVRPNHPEYKNGAQWTCPSCQKYLGVFK